MQYSTHNVILSMYAYNHPLLGRPSIVGKSQMRGGGFCMLLCTSPPPRDLIQLIRGRSSAYICAFRHPPPREICSQKRGWVSACLCALHRPQVNWCNWLGGAHLLKYVLLSTPQKNMFPEGGGSACLFALHQPQVNWYNWLGGAHQLRYVQLSTPKKVCSQKRVDGFLHAVS